MSVPLKVPDTAKGEADLDTNNGVFIVNWCPGNGTWYRLMFTPLEKHMLKASGFDISSGAYLVTWIIPGEACFSYVFREGGYLAYSYVQEKLCGHRGSCVDASELTRIIGLVLKRKTGLCTDEHGRGIA